MILQIFQLRRMSSENRLPGAGDLSQLDEGGSQISSTIGSVSRTSSIRGSLPVTGVSEGEHRAQTQFFHHKAEAVTGEATAISYSGSCSGFFCRSWSFS